MHRPNKFQLNLYDFLLALCFALYANLHKKIIRHERKEKCVDPR